MGEILLESVKYWRVFRYPLYSLKKYIGCRKKGWILRSGDSSYRAYFYLTKRRMCKGLMFWDERFETTTWVEAST